MQLPQQNFRRFRPYADPQEIYLVKKKLLHFKALIVQATREKKLNKVRLYQQQANHLRQKIFNTYGILMD